MALSSQEFDVLNRKLDSLRREVRAQSELLDTWNTPLWKRVLFVIRGYRFRRLGRWYRARWNDDAAEYDIGGI